MKQKNIFLLIIIILLTLLIIIILFCPSYNPKAVSLPQENGSIEVFFSRTDDCETRLEQILNSSSMIKAALYDLDDQPLISILKNKNADVLVDEDNYFGYGTNISSPGLMHNKFWLVYNSSGKDYVITGSLNPTHNDIYKNDNNLIIINSNYLEKNYEAEFNEIKNKQANQPTTYQKIIFNNNLLENYFCPDDDCESKVLNTLKSANKSVYFMTFSFTSNALGDYLVSKKQRLDIRGVFDESQVKSQEQYTEYYKMLDNGLNVKLDGNTAKLHHKVFIIDNETIITGSYNPTSAGTSRNDENILIIHEPGIAAKFLQEFDRVWAVAK
jgi:phosphatidylserine/phosphatidylglycerophosphate/cardiolipin synthase-like enzyme